MHSDISLTSSFAPLHCAEHDVKGEKSNVILRRPDSSQMNRQDDEGSRFARARIFLSENKDSALTSCEIWYFG